MGKFEIWIKDFEKKFNEVYSFLNTKNDVTEFENKQSGIYALYIKSYKYKIEEENIYIPIYIGQTNDFVRRKNEHFRELNKIMNLSKKEFNQRLKKHKEKGYLYFKIRNILEKNNLTISDVFMKVIEECSNDKNILNDKEKKYIDTLYSVQYGFNQFETIQLVTQFKGNDEYFYRFLLSTKKDFEDCINEKYIFGFRDFNIKILCYNVTSMMSLMNKYNTENKELLKLNQDVINLIYKMQELYYDYAEYKDLSFIEYYLKI